MSDLRREAPIEFAGRKTVKVTDYEDTAATGLPKANVLRYDLEDGAVVIVRPSGTEPKIKTYFTTLGKDLSEAEKEREDLAKAVKPILA
jgi:phosphoglucomutase